jgi:hypothetical protein
MKALSIIGFWILMTCTVVGAVVILNQLTIWVKSTYNRLRDFEIQCELPDIEDVEP